MHYVGGNALLTTIDKTGMTQRVVHRWTEDHVGEVIKPKAIDWKERFSVMPHSLDAK